MKRALKTLHKNQYSHAHLKVKEYRNNLANIEIRLASSNEVKLQLAEKELGDKLRHWSSIEDSILRQKARISWINLADSKTKFFFNAMKIRKARNAISVIQNVHGEMFTRREDIQAEGIDFYKNLMGTSASSLPSIDLQTIKYGPNWAMMLGHFLVG